MSLMADQTENKNHMIDRVDCVVRFIALWAGAIFLLALTLVTVLDVTLRTVFNSPIHGGRDLAQFSLIIVVCASIAYSARSGGQVVVELFENFASKNFMRLVDIGVKFIGFVMLLVLSGHLLISGNDASEFGEASGTLEVSYGPFMYAAAFGIFLYAIVLLAEIFQLIRGRSIAYNGD
jgi:TRAP-type C4-dicarboxylate transport system permease small subunit